MDNDPFADDVTRDAVMFTLKEQIFEGLKKVRDNPEGSWAIPISFNKFGRFLIIIQKDDDAPTNRKCCGGHK